MRSRLVSGDPTTRRAFMDISKMLRRIIQHVVRAIPIVDDVAPHGIPVPPSRLVMLDLAVGAALYAQPPHVKLPGLAALAAVRALARRIRNRRNQRRRRDPSPSSASSPSASPAALSPPSPGLRWRRVTCEIAGGGRGKRPSKTILRDVAGSARPGRLLAILGPSGSGKTSLLNVLAGHVPANKRTRLRGSLTRDGVEVAEGAPPPGEAQRSSGRSSSYAVAYVQQSDVFYSQLTVRETLETAARMRASGSTSGTRNRSALLASVDLQLRRFGLAKCADTRVGDVKTRGISGGERKRLALACELIGASPDAVCCDEPTSGLDAFQAQRVMESLRDVARGGGNITGGGGGSPGGAHGHSVAVVASVHQPRGSIVTLFDDVCVLAEGRVAYCGPTSEAPRWFREFARTPIPANCNPAEFMVDVVSVDHSSAEAEAESERRVARLCDAWAREGPRFVAEWEAKYFARDYKGGGGSGSSFGGVAGLLSSPFRSQSGRSLLAREAHEAEAEARRRGETIEEEKSSDRRLKPHPIRQFFFLFRRSFRQVRRDSKTNTVRLLTSLNSALVFGSIFWKMGLTQSSIQDRLGLLQVSAINAAMAALMKTISAFTSEKVVVDRERASGWYDAAPYLLAKLVAELPAGAFFPLAFGAVVYPMTGLHPKPERFASFAGTVVLESFAASALGLAVSAAAPSSEAAVAMGPAVMVLFIVFGGYYVNPENVPACFRWINAASLIKWAFQGLCATEFRGLDFEPGGLRGDTRHGEEVLERLGFGSGTTGEDDGELAGAAFAAKEQANVLGALYLVTLWVLERNAPRFATIRFEREASVEEVSYVKAHPSAEDEGISEGDDDDDAGPEESGARGVSAADDKERAARETEPATP